MTAFFNDIPTFQYEGPPSEIEFAFCNKINTNGVKLWQGIANLFSHECFVGGAATNPAWIRRSNWGVKTMSLGVDAAVKRPC